jgi:hypothetical protein
MVYQYYKYNFIHLNIILIKIIIHNLINIILNILINFNLMMIINHNHKNNHKNNLSTILINHNKIIMNNKIKNLFSNQVNNHLFIINIVLKINLYIINQNKDVFYNLNHLSILTKLVI